MQNLKEYQWADIEKELVKYIELTIAPALDCESCGATQEVQYSPTRASAQWVVEAIQRIVGGGGAA